MQAQHPRDVQSEQHDRRHGHAHRLGHRRNDVLVCLGWVYREFLGPLHLDVQPALSRQGARIELRPNVVISFLGTLR